MKGKRLQSLLVQESEFSPLRFKNKPNASKPLKNSYLKQNLKSVALSPVGHEGIFRSSQGYSFDKYLNLH